MMKRLMTVSMWLGVLWLLTGCSTTQLTSVWKDSLYQKHPAKVLVVAISKKPVNRRILEDEFVALLKTRGTEAIASYTVLNDRKQEDQEAIAAKVKELGVDSLLMTRLVSSRTVKVYMPTMPYFPPPYYGTWPDYYNYGYRYMYSPGYVSEEQYAIMETNLYDAEKDNLIWSAASETEISGADQKDLKEYVGVMVNNMAQYELVNKLPKK